MTRLGEAFDANEHEDLGSFDPIPAADYIVQVVKSDYCTTNDKQGKYIKLEFEVLDGPCKGRKVWNNLNVVNKSQAAMEIAKKGLATLCRVVGLQGVQDTQELHGIPFILKVGIKPAEGDYPKGNKVNGYAPLKATVKNPKGTPQPKKEPVVDEGSSDSWG